MKPLAALATLLSFAACSSTPTQRVPPAPPTASAIASASASAEPVADEAIPPPVGAKDGAPTLVHQLTLGRDAWSTYSADGKLAATLLPGALALIDVDTGRVRGTTPIDCVGGATFTSDNRFVLFSDCAGNGWVREWDLAQDHVEATTVPVADAALLAEPRGRRVLVFSHSAATLIDAWSREATVLEVPAGTEVLHARFAHDGAVILFGERDVLRYARGQTTPTVTAIGRGALVILAATVDPTASRAAVLLASGEAMVFDPATGKTVARAGTCGDETPKSIHFLTGSEEIVAHCGAAVTRFDGALQNGKQYFYDDKAPFDLELVGQKLFVQRPHELALYDVVARTWSKPIAIEHAVALGGGARAARRSGSHVVDASTGNSIWEPSPGLPAVVRDVREKAALFDANEAIDLRTGEAFDYSDISWDGGVILRTIVMPNAKGDLETRATVAHRDGSGNAWSAPLAPDMGAVALSASGKYVLEAVVDYTKNPDGVPTIIVHGPGLTRRIASYGGLITTLDDRLVLEHYRNEQQVIRFYDLATGADTVSDLTFMPEQFAANGARFVEGSEVFDTSTRRRVWMLPDDESVAWFAQDSDAMVAYAGTDLAQFRVLSVKDGKELFTTTEPGAVSMASRDVLLLVRDGRSVLVKRGAKPVELPRWLGARRISRDGSVVWYQRPDRMVAAYRVSDGRELLFSLGGAPVTDQGVFDPKDGPRVRLLVRSGPNLLESALSSVIDAPEKYAHPNLVADFLAGAPVSPR